MKGNNSPPSFLGVICNPKAECLLELPGWDQVFQEGGEAGEARFFLRPKERLFEK